ncbi:MAG: M28 family peptidase [Deltaproteobacteria bacterium]|nr:M28 family peptidase [Deltaproteobacteria bacterium]
MDFNGEEAVKIAKSLAFPRAVGSAGEQMASSFIEKKLIDSGYLLQREEFFVPLTPWGVIKTFALLALVISIDARMLAPSFPIASSILIFLMVAFLAFYTFFWFKLLGSASIFRWLISRKKKERLLRSHNITASLPGHGRPGPHLYLIAHYDSKSQSLSLLHRAFFLLLSGLSLLWLGFSFLSSSSDALGSFPSLGVDFPLTLSILGIIPLLLLKTTNQSPGGLDNAGSLGVLLHLAEGLKGERPLRPGVTFLFSGAEELGLQGAFAYLREHEKEIEKENSYFLNLDAVGIKGKLRIFSRKGFLPVGGESFLLSRLKEIAKPFKIGTWPFSFGFLMDHQAILEKGYQAVTLACPSKKILNVHTEMDTADHLEQEGMEEAGKFILAWLRSWEK